MYRSGEARRISVAPIMRDGGFRPVLIDDGKRNYTRGWSAKAEGASFKLDLLLREDLESVYFRAGNRVHRISHTLERSDWPRNYDDFELSANPPITLSGKLTPSGIVSEITVGRQAHLDLSISMLITLPVKEIVVIHPALAIPTQEYSQIILDFLRKG